MQAKPPYRTAYRVLKIFASKIAGSSGCFRLPSGYVSVI